MIHISNKTNYVISKMPKAGLGNKLFSWASGVIFSEANNRKHIITGLTRIHPKAILRKDKSARFYFGYFKNERLLYLNLIKPYKVLNQRDANSVYRGNNDVIFNEIPHWSNSFHVLKEKRDLIVNKYWSTLTQDIISRIKKHPEPEIGVHIRLGDFRKLRENEDFSKVGSVRTPIDYFVKIIHLIRNEIGQDLKVTIFSDGTDEELKDVLSLLNTSRAKDDLDIVHLSVLSKSKVIVMSAGSTFSFWAGFLSNAILINHYQHIHESIRSEVDNRKYYEGSIDTEKSILEQDLKDALQNLSK